MVNEHGLEVRTSMPRGKIRGVPLVFIHGAWHGAWCWDQGFTDYFVQLGYPCYALSLRNHGGSKAHGHPKFTRIREYIEDLHRIIEPLPDPVLIGHSMGGFIAQKYMERYSGVSAGVLLASAPPRGLLRTVLGLAPQAFLPWCKAHLTFDLKAIVETPDLAHKFLFSRDMERGRVLDYAGRLTGESYWAFLDMLFRDLPRPAAVLVPLLVLGAGRDAIFSEKQMNITHEFYPQSQLHMFPHMAHNMMLEEGWEAVADHIHEWLNQELPPAFSEACHQSA